MLKRFIVLVSVLLPLTARADLTAYRCTGPTQGPVRVISSLESACQGFVTGGKQVLFNRLESGHLLASKDGRTVVMIEDYLYGHVEGKHVQAISDLDVVLDPHVLTVYRDGQRVAAYDLARLVKDLDKVGHSISHIRWVAELPNDLDGDRFTLTTVNKREIDISTRDGKILAERDAP